MANLADTSRRTMAARWWTTPTAGTWLEVTTARARGGATDGATALDYVGAGSWVHGDRAYLSEDDAYRWIAAVGINGADVPSAHMARRPDGYGFARDAGAADVADNVPGATADYFGAMADAHYGPAGEVHPPADDVPPADDAPPELVPVYGDVAAPTAPAAPTVTAGSSRGTKASRREANRALAAEVRRAGHVPNGAAWDAARRLVAAGTRITAGTMAAELLAAEVAA